MNSLAILMLASLPAIGAWMAAKIHFEADAMQVLTEVKRKHERLTARAIKTAYTVGYKDGQAGNVHQFYDFADKA